MSISFSPYAQNEESNADMFLGSGKTSMVVGPNRMSVSFSVPFELTLLTTTYVCPAILEPTGALNVFPSIEVGNEVLTLSPLKNVTKKVLGNVPFGMLKESRSPCLTGRVALVLRAGNAVELTILDDGQERINGARSVVTSSAVSACPRGFARMVSPDSPLWMALCIPLDARMASALLIS